MKKAAVPSILVAVVLLAVAVIAEAQQPKKVPRMGFIASVSRGRLTRRCDGIPPRDCVILAMWREKHRHRVPVRGGKLDRLPDLAAELVSLKVDVIVAAEYAWRSWLLKSATSTIPIVFATSGDPVATGLVASLGAARRNITG